MDRGCPNVRHLHRLCHHHPREGGCGVVRVVNRDTDDRILIKGTRGAVVDLSFAHAKEEVVVGALGTCLYTK